MVSHVYDRVAERYDEDWSDIYANSRSEFIQQLVRHFGKELSSLDAVDFAVGTGNSFKDIRDHFTLGKCTGFDISSGMLSLAKRKLANEVNLIQQDATKAVDLIPAESVDLVMSHFLLNFVESEKVIESSLKLLRPGGVFSIVTSTQQSLSELHYGRFYLTSKLIGVKRSLSKMGTPETHRHNIERLEQCGFEIVEETIVNQAISFKSFADIRSWAVDSGWMVSSLDKKLGLRITLGRVLLALLSVFKYPLYPINASTEISIILARKPERQMLIKSAA